ncbi:hypothetical protein L2E82_08261 [Cichorium intybus]|uniref:Uncharacterized protein n=1 Tax=Cichorium intybus TaxID=13427 RepID=A0ACB9G6P5_CICIN|nr:hypothetical protein L2E82_08261 [Cichorium intybus]
MKLATCKRINLVLLSYPGLTSGDLSVSVWIDACFYLSGKTKVKVPTVVMDSGDLKREARLVVEEDMDLDINRRNSSFKYNNRHTSKSDSVLQATWT